MLSRQFAGHLCVAMHARITLESFSLDGSGCQHSLSDDFAALGWMAAAKVGDWHRRHFDVDVSTSMDYRGQHFCIEIIIIHMPQTTEDS